MTPPDRPALRLPRAALCLDCEAIFAINGHCPACGSTTWAPLSKFLNRPAKETT